jgi:hypothetical protein
MAGRLWKTGNESEFAKAVHALIVAQGVGQKLSCCPNRLLCSTAAPYGAVAMGFDFVSVLLAASTGVKRTLKLVATGLNDGK